jgi:hypothetical protein
MADKKTINGTDRWVTITASDTVNLLENPRAIHCDVGGTAVLVGADDVAISFVLSAGSGYPYQPKRINSTGTTATGLKALY